MVGVAEKAACTLARRASEGESPLSRGARFLRAHRANMEKYHEHVGNVLHVVQPITRPLPENRLMNGQPKPGFYIVVALVVLALVIFAVVRSDIFAPKSHQKTQTIDPEALKPKPEAPDASTPTTVSVYKFVPQERLPEVTGTSAYTPLEKTSNTVKF